jgi:hypothetical protein
MPIRLLATAVFVPAVALGAWAVAAMVESDPPDQPEVHARIDGPVLTRHERTSRGGDGLVLPFTDSEPCGEPADTAFGRG